MSVESEILRIQHNVADAYAQVAEKGGNVPLQPNSDNLPAAVASIPAGGESETFLVKSPIGAIVIWSGTADNIPKGWQLCDGANGTPDLRDRFVLGAGNTYAAGAKGGSASRTLSAANMPAHSHSISSNDLSAPAGGQAINATRGTTGSVPTTVTTSTAGSSSSFSIMPPYYALCYIMKLADDPADCGEIYSTGETRIGTWIDGKPLYRRCFQAVYPTSENTPGTVGSIDGVDMMPTLKGTVQFEAGDVQPVPYYYTAAHFGSLSFRESNVYLLKQGPYYNGKPFFVICEYTKTADEPEVF